MTLQPTGRQQPLLHTICQSVPTSIGRPDSLIGEGQLEHPVSANKAQCCRPDRARQPTYPKTNNVRMMANSCNALGRFSRQPLPSIARCSAGQGHARHRAAMLTHRRATAEAAVVLESALRSVQEWSVRPGREDANPAEQKDGLGWCPLVCRVPSAEGNFLRKQDRGSLHTLCTCGADTRVARDDQRVDRNRELRQTH
jgi:hypothetical protein